MHGVQAWARPPSYTHKKFSRVTLHCRASDSKNLILIGNQNDMYDIDNKSVTDRPDSPNVRTGIASFSSTSTQLSFLLETFESHPPLAAEMYYLTDVSTHSVRRSTQQHCDLRLPSLLRPYTDPQNRPALHHQPQQPHHEGRNLQ